MGVLIEIGEQNEWHLILNEQFNIPNGNRKPHEVMDFLIEKGIIFGVTYSDYGLHIHLQNVEYIDDNYDNFLKVASDILAFKMKFNKLIVPPPTDEEKIQQVFTQPQEPLQPLEPQEPLQPMEPLEPEPTIETVDLPPEQELPPAEDIGLKQPPKQ